MKGMPKGIAKQDVLDAVYHGVYDAIWQMITNNTISPCADFYYTIEQAAKQAFTMEIDEKNTKALP